MTNIFTEAKHRTKYIKALEKITLDGQISYQRLIISLGLAVALVIIYIAVLIGDGQRIKYIFIPATLMLIALMILLANYMISSRNKSMLESTFTLITHKLAEKLRRKTKRSGDTGSLGIRDVRSGVLFFDNGDTGLVYQIEGHLSLSVLPAVAKAAADAKSRYLVSRYETVNELLVTSIKEVSAKSQLANLRQYALRDHQTPEGLWSQYMATMIYQYVDQNIANKEYTISQILILRDENIDSLKKSKQIFESAVANGLYASATLVVNKSEITELLAPLALLSKRGVQIHGKEETKELKRK